MSCSMQSVFQHPLVIDEHLEQEMMLNHVVGQLPMGTSYNRDKSQLVWCDSKNTKLENGG